MKKMIWMMACSVLAACALGQGSDLSETSTSTDEIHGPVILAMTASAGPEAIDAQAILASTPACHGVTSCDGGSIISNEVHTVDCGPRACGGAACPLRNPVAVQLVQPRETYTAWAMPDGKVCLLYKPTTSRPLVPAQCGIAQCPL